MMRRPRTTTAKVVEIIDIDSDLSTTQIISSDENGEEWRPSEPKPKAASKTASAPAAGEKKAAAKRTANVLEGYASLESHTRSTTQIISSDEDGEEWRPSEPKPKAASKTARAPAAGEKKAAAKRTAKPKEPKEPKEPKVPKEPKPRAPRKPAAERKPQARKALTKSAAPGLAVAKRKIDDEGQNKEGEKQTGGPEESGPSAGIKKERLSFSPRGPNKTYGGAGEGSSMAFLKAKKEEIEEEDFTFGEPCLKKQKTMGSGMGRPTALPPSSANALRNELGMNWDLIELLSILTCVEQWVSVNIISLLREENTVPFMVRYRKEMINHMDADAVRDVQLVYEELRSLAKKTQSAIQTLKKDGVLTTELEQDLRSCRSADELDHVYSPYKKGSKLTKARRAKALGLEEAASILLDSPHTLDLRAWVKPGSEGLSSVEEVSTGVEHILADMIAKDPETLTFIKTLCENSFVQIQSSVSKSALKGKEPDKTAKGHQKPGAQQNKNKDIDKFHLYFDFTSNIQSIQSHQTLAINRGESLKI
ncbi:S1 RNA-binding domain-containing protein 1-like isoform X2 [Notolabrus celidotus]|uniref:S1 RNA-binding domain-containing protein 1-like isoform X2 n=1 Tax=Notolabrus celidotus TaxID=1203425 RepID=UPI0014904C33|nr:S1 RNA-binding domain-containing protein 1-like isoform X2 [Notolabrus celidotus]